MQWISLFPQTETAHSVQDQHHEYELTTSLILSVTNACVYKLWIDPVGVWWEDVDDESGG